MKFFRFVVISIIGLFVLATLFGLIFPSTVYVSRVVDITAPKDSIYQYIKDIKGWQSWMDGLNDPSVQVDNSLKAHIAHTVINISVTPLNDSVVNAIWQTSNNGNQESKIEIIQGKGQPSAAVHWQFVQHIGWLPWERFSSMMNDKIMGTMMEKDLNNLKTLVEGH